MPCSMHVTQLGEQIGAGELPISDRLFRCLCCTLGTWRWVHMSAASQQSLCMCCSMVRNAAAPANCKDSSRPHCPALCIAPHAGKTNDAPTSAVHYQQCCICLQYCASDILSVPAARLASSSMAQVQLHTTAAVRQQRHRLQQRTAWPLLRPDIWCTRYCSGHSSDCSHCAATVPQAWP